MMSTDDFKVKIYNMVGDEYEVLGEYKGANVNILMRHNVCGHEWSPRPTNFTRRKKPTRCPKCAGNIRKTTEEFKKDVYKLYKDKYSVIGRYINSDTNIEMKCNICETTWSPIPYDILGGKSGCPECKRVKLSKINTKTTENFINDVYNLTKGEYEVIGEYINSITPIKILHTKCKNIINIRPKHFLRGDRCKYCADKKLKLTNDEFQDRLYSIHGFNYIPLSKYKGIDKSIKIKHVECGHEYETLPEYIFKNQGLCPICNKYTDKSLDVFEKEIKNLEGDSYKILSDYNDSNTPIFIEHVECGHKYYVRRNDFLKGNRCPKCAGLIKNNNDFINEVNNITGNEYDVVEKYINSKTPILMKHNTCGHEWKVSPNSFLSGSRCPECYKSTSIGEQEIFSYIKEIYDGTVINNDRKILEGQELDIYIPEKKLAIEYNGLYWHSDKFIDKDYHLNKTKLCNDKNIRLLHIFENEWELTSDIIKSKIAYLLNHNSIETIYARNCDIVFNIDSKVKRDFLNENHIQGNDRSSSNIGLKYENELIAIMTFGKGIANRASNTLELSRFAVMKYKSIPGAFSRLLKNYLRNNKDVEKLYSYADIRLSQGDVYEKNGWIVDRISKPSYYYNKNGNRLYHKSSFKKSNIRDKYPEVYDDDKTEFEMMNELNYNRIWDCGKIRYKKIIGRN